MYLKNNIFFRLGLPLVDCAIVDGEKQRKVESEGQYSLCNIQKPVLYNSKRSAK